jgi:hypothetical protein
MNTVYKKNGSSLEVNDHALKFLDELNLSTKPILSLKKSSKKSKKAK